MKKIELSIKGKHKGKYAAIIDDEDYNLVIKHRWSVALIGNSIYARSNKGGRGVIFLHRLILCAKKGEVVDHINGNGLDCQKINLRVCTHGQNMANRKPSKNGTSKYLGVSWDRFRNKWCAQITYNKKSIKIGRYNTELEAAEAYREYALKYHKEFISVFAQ